MPKRNLAWVLVIVMIALLMWQLPKTIAGRDTLIQAFGPLVDVRAQIHKRYVREVDDEKLVEGSVNVAIKNMIEQLGDPYAVYLNAREYARFQKRAEGLFGGIGVDVWITSRGLEVLSREPHSPAIEAGLLPADLITHIDGHPTQGLALEEIVNNMLNGPPDTTVCLTARTPGQLPREVIVRRALIEFDVVRGFSRNREGGWRYMLDDEARIGYIRITKFTSNVVAKLDAAVERLEREGFRGLVLDLRQNTGGLLDPARDVADRFLSEGRIFETRGRRTDGREWFASREGDYPGVKVSVLIDGSTASAAEIVAGALKDNQRARIVGERSYGKGCVQEVVQLKGGGAIKLTTAYYYLPLGECIQRTAENEAAGTWGVKPHISVELTDAQRRAWFEAWREIGREPASQPTSQPATGESPGRPEGEVAEQNEAVERNEAAMRLLAVDPVLSRALEFMRRGMEPTTRPAGLSDDVPVAARP